jgi:hypothetical protein
MGRPLPTSAWDILPYLQDENIYDCEENNLEILKQAIIDEIVGLRSDVVRLHDERVQLREALKDARECVEGWASYAGDYFRDKHDLEGDLARIDAVLGAPT